jgi:hypothetical protein
MNPPVTDRKHCTDHAGWGRFGRLSPVAVATPWWQDVAPIEAWACRRGVKPIAPKGGSQARQAYFSFCDKRVILSRPGGRREEDCKR